MSGRGRKMTFWWIAGGMLVLVGAVVFRDRKTRHRVVRAIARRWEKGQKRSAKGRARAHLQQRRASAKALPQAQRAYQRPSRPRMLATKCSAACRTSRKPAFDPKTKRLLCDCPCGGREHGMYRKGATGQPKLPKQAAGSSGTKRAAAATSSKPSTPKPAAKPAAAPGGVTNINEGGTVGVQRGTGAPGIRVTNISRGGVVGIQAGTVSGETVVVPVSKAAPPPPPKSWRGLQVSSWDAMRKHADKSPRCAGGTFSAKTFRDRRTDPPRITQEMSCDTCGRAVS